MSELVDRKKEKIKPESYQTSLNPCSSPRKNSLRLLTLYKSKSMFIKLYSLRFGATNKFIIKFFAVLFSCLFTLSHQKINKPNCNLTMKLLTRGTVRREVQMG